MQPPHTAEVAVWVNPFSSSGEIRLDVRHFHGVQRRAVRAHQPRDGRANHLAPQFPFKGPQHRVIQEGAALHHHVPPQFLRRSRRG